MTNLQDFSNIALIGMRCTGKSGVGKHLAKQLNWKFYDIDDEIISKCGKNISEITNNGENWRYFRELETEILEKLLKINKVVISCGGGCGVNDILYDKSKTFGEIQAKMLQNNANTLKILLKSDQDIIISRFENEIQHNRPSLMKNRNYRDEIILQLDKRKDLYNKIAHFSVNTNHLETEFLGIINEIEKKIQTKSCAVIGNPVKHSLSPNLHNHGYEKLGINDRYEFKKITIKPNDLHRIRDIIVSENLYGISVTTPHKIEIMKYLDKVDITARKIGSVNTVVRNKFNELTGYNTDYIGIIDSLPRNLSGLKIAILGNGGVARAACYGLRKYNYNITIFGRNVEKIKQLSTEFSMKYEDIAEINVEKFDIIINATSCGHKFDECPIDTANITVRHTIFDLIYSPLKTKLLQEAESKGAKIILGTQMLVHQAKKQFLLYTGYKISPKILNCAILDILNKRNSVQELMTRVFISVTGVSIEEMVENIEKNRKISQNLEIRADYIKNITIDDVRKIADATRGLNVIFTCRKLQNGGFYTGDDYRKIMQYAVQNFALVDIDISDCDMVKNLDQYREKVILSHHDFKKTLGVKKMNELYGMFQQSGAGVFKIAMFAKSEKDIQKHINYLDKFKNTAVITMSNEFKIHRAYSLILGNKLAFAAMENGTKSAIGQLKYQEYLEFLNSNY